MKRKEWLVIHPRLSRVGSGFVLKPQAFFRQLPSWLPGELQNSTFIVGGGILETPETNETRGLCSPSFPLDRETWLGPWLGRVMWSRPSVQQTEKDREECSFYSCRVETAPGVTEAPPTPHSPTLLEMKGGSGPWASRRHFCLSLSLPV